MAVILEKSIHFGKFLCRKKQFKSLFKKVVFKNGNGGMFTAKLQRNETLSEKRCYNYMVQRKHVTFLILKSQLHTSQTCTPAGKERDSFIGYGKYFQKQLEQNPAYERYFSSNLYDTFLSTLDKKVDVDEILDSLVAGMFPNNLNSTVTWLVLLHRASVNLEDLKCYEGYRKMMRYFDSNMQHLTNEQLLLLLQRQVFCKDSVLEKKLVLCSMNTLDKDLLFSIGSAVFCSNRTKNIKKMFMSSFLKRIQNFKTLYSEEIVMLFLFANISFFNPFMFVPKLEETLLRMVDDISLDEVANICQVLSKIHYQNPGTCTNTFMKTFALAVAEKLVSNKENLDQQHVPSMQVVYKFLTYFFGLGESVLTNLFKNGKSENLKILLPDFDITTLIRGASLSRKLLRTFEELENAIKTQVSALVEGDSGHRVWRVKDIANCMFIIGDLGYSVSQEMMMKLLTILRKKLEASVKPDDGIFVVIGALRGMSMMNIYNVDMVELFQKYSDHLAKADVYKDGVDFYQDVYQFDQAVKIEYPEYRGKLLDKKYLEELPYDHMLFKNIGVALNKSKQSRRDTLISDIVWHLNDLYGRRMFDLGYLLPSSTLADILFCVDEHNVPIPAHKWKYELKLYISMSTGFEERKQKKLAAFDCPKENLVELENGLGIQKRVAVVFVGPSGLIDFRSLDGTEKKILRGNTRAKLRQIEKVGYQVIEILVHEYWAAEDKRQFLQDKLGQHIDTKNCQMTEHLIHELQKRLQIKPSDDKTTDM